VWLPSCRGLAAIVKSGEFHLLSHLWVLDYVNRIMANSHSEYLLLTLKKVDINRKDPLFSYQIEVTWSSHPLFGCCTELQLTCLPPQSTLPHFQHKTGSGERTYTEFERFALHLTLIYEDIFVPALPDVTVSTFAGQRPDDEGGILLSRIQRWINRVTSHPRFKSSHLLREFVESGHGVGALENWHRERYPTLLNID
jgi:hypothetical protein